MRLPVLLPVVALLACGLSTRPLPQSARDAAQRARDAAGEVLGCRPDRGWVRDAEWLPAATADQACELCMRPPGCGVTACQIATDSPEIDGMWATIWGSDPVIVTAPGQDVEGAARHEATHAARQECWGNSDADHKHTDLWCATDPHWCRR